MRGIDYIVIHCADTKPSMDIGVKEIRNWHTRINGWSDVGYHFVIRRDGSVEEGRDITRIGAHVKGFNNHSIGICWVGGANEETMKPEDNRTEEQKVALRAIIDRMLSAFPDAVLMGHNDFPGVQKDCPCFDVCKWYYE
tara:strand:+ start:677 stop:1093 length:417 start_codon:yes stop_codon:yes gene_type:complete